MTTSRRVELTSEQDPEKEQDLDLGEMEVEESGFVDRLSSFEEGTGEDDGVDVVAIRVGVLDITDSIAWHCLDIEQLSSTKTTFSNL